MAKKFKEVVKGFENIYGTETKDVTDREIKGTPCARSGKQRDTYFKVTSSISMEFPYWYTRQYMLDDSEIPVVRRARALKEAFSRLTPMIVPGELLVMKKARYFRGSYPNPWLLGSGYLPEDDPNRIASDKTGASAPGSLSHYGAGGAQQNDTDKVASVEGKFAIRQEELPVLQKLAYLWVGKSVEDIRRKYEPMVPEYETKEKLMQSIMIMCDSGFTLPQGREVTDFYYPLQYGFDGIKKIAEEKRAEVAGVVDGDGLIGSNRLFNYHAIILVIEGIQKWINNYAKESRYLATVTKDKTQKKEYEEIADILERIEHHPPKTFREAFQMLEIVHLAILNEDVITGLAPGRVGQILYPYFEQDIENGRITEEEVVELLELDRVKKTSIDAMGPKSVMGGINSGSTFNCVSLGGVTRDNQPAANRLEELIIQSAINCGTTQPTFCLLCDDKLPPDFMLLAAKCVKSGCGMPAFVNNQNGRDFMLSHYGPEGMTVRDARAWAIGGCLECSPGAWHLLTLNDKEYWVPGGAMAPTVGVHFVNLPKMLELVLFNGKDHVTGLQVFAPHDNTLETFEELHKQYKLYWQEACHVMNKCNTIQMDIWRKNNMPIFNSILKPDCLEKGHILDEMGARYNATFVVETTGTSSLVNSMIALEQIVYNDKKATLDDFRAAILDNFGYKTAEEAGSSSLNAQVKKEDDTGKWDKLHPMAMHAPKYGNADKFADDQMKSWEEFFCNDSPKYQSLFGLPMMSNQIAVSTQAPQGAATLATPDGRLGGTTFQDGSMSAFAGTDKKGPYALFTSATCWDQSMSLNTQMNMKLHPTAIKGPEGTQNLVNLTLGYMRKGGFHIQYNVLDSRMLKDAQDHPDQYQGLMVRVAGFTQYWAELGKPVQDEIISRTEYNKL